MLLYLDLMLVMLESGARGKNQAKASLFVKHNLYSGNQEHPDPEKLSSCFHAERGCQIG